MCQVNIFLTVKLTMLFYDILIVQTFFRNKGSCYKLEEIITNTKLCKDIAKMSTCYQTSSLEAFHSVINQFAPKMFGFIYKGQLCR